MNANVNDIAGFDAAAEEIRYVYAERDRLRDENEAFRQFKTDICEVLGVGGNSHNDGVVKLLKAVKSRTNLETDDNRMYRDILDDLMKYFKMTASHWKYSDVPHFIKTAHEFALEKKEAAEDALREFGEDICKELGVNYEMSTDATILSEAKRLREGVNKQEEFTKEAASILGVHPGDLSLSDVLVALHKLKREEKLDEMNCEIIANLKEERDKVQQDYLNEIGRRKTAERYISDAFEKISKELDLGRVPESVADICDEIACFRNYRNRISCPKEFWEAMCDIMEMDACDAVPSDVVGMTNEVKRRLISILALNPDTATWTDIYDAIKAEQKDHCNLISESYKMKNELEGLRDALDKENEDFNKALRKTDEEALRQMRESYISIIKQIGGGDAPEDEDLAWYEHRIIELFKDLKKKSENYRQSHVFRVVCVHLGIGWENSTLSDVAAAIDELKKLEQDKTFLKRELKHTDERRQHWVRRYKSEHEKAVNLDKLYREWKDKYETYYKHTSNMAEQNESLMASYMAIKGRVVKQKDILKVVCRYLAGKDTMPDKDIVVRLNEMWTKEIGWDGLVEHYGGKAIRELVDACDDEITEMTRKDLDEMLDNKIPE